MIAPALIFLCTLAVSASVELQQDLALTFGRTSDSLGAQLFNLVSNYVLLFDWTFMVALGLTGIFLIESRSVRWLTLLILFTVLVNTMRMFANAGDLNLHRYLGILPLLAVGAAQFVTSAYCFVTRQVKADLQSARELQRFVWLPWDGLQNSFGPVIAGILLFVLLLWMVLVSVALTLPALAPRPTRLDFVSVTNPDDAREITAWVNQETQPEDIVLASPTVAWLLDARAADFQQALSFSGVQTPNYGAGVAPSRFLYDVSFKNAKFIIVDRLWLGWASDAMPELKQELRMTENWRRVKQVGEFEVYLNPLHVRQSSLR
jgi:hypothetical protein